MAVEKSHLSLLTEIEHTHRSYVGAIHRLRDPELDTQFREMLAKQGNLVNGPFLEVQASYALAAESAPTFEQYVGAPVDDATRVSIAPHPRLYAHQARALELVRQNKNCVVASGTGSGKTEAFLFPILLHLYQEALSGSLARPGVRALILYPMNALSNDQLDRLKEVAESLVSNGSKFRFTYGQYTGETPRDDKDASRDAASKLQNRRTGELVTREEMQRNPPHILLTNYSMLEYLLLRPDDSPLFDHGNGAQWRFLVVDEAHQYNGTKGTEISFLIRRLKQRLREGGREKQFTTIATSATIGGTESDRADVATFAADLFGEPFEADNILFGERVAIPDVADIADPATLPDGPLRHSAAQLSDPAFRNFLEAAMADPQSIAELSSNLSLPTAEIESLASEVAALVDPQTGRTLTNVRYHLYLRTIPGLYARYHPSLQVGLNPLDDAGVWFHLGLCRRCGQHYLMGECQNGKYSEVTEPSRNRYWRPEYNEADLGDAWRVNTRTGEMVQGGLVPTESDQSWIVLQAAPQSEKSDNAFTSPTCITCGFKSQDPIRNPRLEIMEPQALLALSLHNNLPRDRARVLAFADGRQDAAKFAVEAQDFSDDVVMRRAVYTIMENQPADSTVTFEDLAFQLATALNRLQVIEFHGQKGHLAAHRFLLREVINRGDAANLVTSGSLTPHVRLPERVRPPERWVVELGFDEARGLGLLERLADSLVEDGALSLTRLQVSVDFAGLETAVRQNSVVMGEVEGRKKIKSWGTLRGRRSALVRSQFSQRTLSDDEVNRILQEAIDVLRTAEDEFDQLMLISAGEGYQLDVARIAFTAGKERLHCTLCGLIQRNGPPVPCPRHRCRGQLVPTTIEPNKEDPFHSLYADSSRQAYFRIEEHTAQLSRTLARR